MTKPRGLIHGRRGPAGYRLAHNFVKATSADQISGAQGFRRFWIPPEWIEKGEWVACDCGWRADLGPHYRGNRGK